MVNQRVSSRILEKHGHRVVLARTGLEIYRGQSFDLILMDVQMPQMGGLEATAAIRAGELDTGNHIPIVAMTAHAMKGDEERFLQAGMDAYVSKPVQPQRLMNIIDELVFADHPESDADDADPANGRPSTPGFDLDVALARVDGDVEILREVAELFCEDAPSLLQQVRDAVAGADARSLEHSAHTLKGAVGNFGAQRAWGCALRLEIMGRGGEMSDAESAVNELEREVRGLMEALADIATCRGNLNGLVNGPSRKLNLPKKRPIRPAVRLTDPCSRPETSGHSRDLVGCLSLLRVKRKILLDQ